jgi:hypothetical protein
MLLSRVLKRWFWFIVKHIQILFWHFGLLNYISIIFMKIVTLLILKCLWLIVYWILWSFKYMLSNTMVIVSVWRHISIELFRNLHDLSLWALRLLIWWSNVRTCSFVVDNILLMLHELTFFIFCISFRWILNNRIAVRGPLSCIQILISNASLLLVSIRNVFVFDKRRSYRNVVFGHILPLTPLLVLHAVVGNMDRRIVHRLFIAWRTRSS